MLGQRCLSLGPVDIAPCRCVLHGRELFPSRLHALLTKANAPAGPLRACASRTSGQR